MRRTLLLACVSALVLLAAPAAHATPAAAGPGGFAAGYLTPIVVIAAGEGITFTNLDIAPHDFVAYDDFLTKKQARKTTWCSAFKGKCPAFWSPRIGVGESTEVLGLENLEAGEQRTFYCTLHPNMRGTLVVR